MPHHCAGNLRNLCFIHMFRQFEILRTTKATIIWIARVSLTCSRSVSQCIKLLHHRHWNHDLTECCNVFGSSVVASFTAASKVNNIATQTMPTLGTAMATYCGQNLGAGKYDRIFDGMRKGFFIVSLLQPSVLPSAFRWRIYRKLVCKQSFR